MLSERVSFRRIHIDSRDTRVVAMFNRPDVHDRDDTTSGLDHVQLRHATLDDMFARDERPKASGSHPTAA